MPEAQPFVKAPKLMSADHINVVFLPVLHMDNLFKQDDLSDLLSQVDTSKIAQSEDFVSGEAMKESQRRYEEIIKKHEEDNE